MHRVKYICMYFYLLFVCCKIRLFDNTIYTKAKPSVVTMVTYGPELDGCEPMKIYLVVSLILSHLMFRIESCLFTICVL